MTSLTGLIVLVGSSLLLWLGLVGLAVTRKLRRDRRELRSVERRAHYETALRGGDTGAIGAICDEVHSVGAQVDLAVSIDAVYPDSPARRSMRIRGAMEASALLSSLNAKLESRRPTTRARAALLLTRPGIPAVVEQIVPLLGDPDPDVRLVACSGLARAATPRAAELLIWALMAHLLPPERIIERLGAPWAVETMISTLKEGPSAVADVLAGIAPCGDEVELDASLARALGLARDPRAAPALVALLDSGLDRGADLRRARPRARRWSGLRAGADRGARLGGLAGSRSGREVARRPAAPPMPSSRSRAASPTAPGGFAQTRRGPCASSASRESRPFSARSSTTIATRPTGPASSSPCTR